MTEIIPIFKSWVPEWLIKITLFIVLLPSLVLFFLPLANVNAAAGFIYGLPEMPIHDVTFDNISISMAENAVPALPAMMSGLEPFNKKGFFCCNARNTGRR